MVNLLQKVLVEKYGRYVLSVLKLFLEYQKKFLIICLSAFLCVSGLLSLKHLQDIEKQAQRDFLEKKQKVNLLVQAIHNYLVFTQKRFGPSLEEHFQPKLGKIPRLPKTLLTDTVLYFTNYKFTSQGRGDFSSLDKAFLNYFNKSKRKSGLYQDPYGTLYIWKQEQNAHFVPVVKISYSSFQKFFNTQEDIRLEGSFSTKNIKDRDLLRIPLSSVENLTFRKLPLNFWPSFISTYGFLLSWLLIGIFCGSCMLMSLYIFLLKKLQKDFTSQLLKAEGENTALRKMLNQRDRQEKSLTQKNELIKEITEKLHEAHLYHIQRVTDLVDVMAQGFNCPQKAHQLNLSDFIFTLKNLVDILSSKISSSPLESLDILSLLQGLVKTFDYEINEKGISIQLPNEPPSGRKVLLSKTQGIIILFNILERILDRAQEKSSLEMQVLFSSSGFLLFFYDSGYKIPLRDIVLKKNSIYNPYFSLSWEKLEILMKGAGIEFGEKIEPSRPNQIEIKFTEIMQQESRGQVIQLYK